MTRAGARFRRVEPRRRARALVVGLLAGLPRKNCWTIAEHAGDATPDGMQHLLAANGYMNEGNTSNYDSVWGSGTDSAKARFDNDHGLTPSPPTDCGARSWESLLNGWVW